MWLLQSMEEANGQRPWRKSYIVGEQKSQDVVNVISLPVEFTTIVVGKTITFPVLPPNVS